MHNEHTKTIKEAINFIERAIVDEVAEYGNYFEGEITINYKFFRRAKNLIDRLEKILEEYEK